MSKAELNYTVTEKVLLIVLHSLNKFRHYITGYQTFVHTDHAAIKYLMNNLDVNSRIIIWLCLLQQFDLTSIDKLGREKLVAYFFIDLIFLQVRKEWLMISYHMSIYSLFQFSLDGFLK